MKKILSTIFKKNSEERENVKDRKVTENDRQAIEESYDHGYQKITAQMIAAENNMGYVKQPNGEAVSSNGNRANKYYLGKGKYMLLYPANDGLPTCPIEWYGQFDGRIQMVMDNQSSFKGITNLSEIILQMVRLYAKYIDDDVFISSFKFAVQLEDEICPNYHGRASLVLTEDSIRNNKVEVSDKLEAKIYFVNHFLDCYIGWNFGKAVKSDSQLEKELNQFNELVIKKGLRKCADPGLEVWESEDVLHYKLRA